MNRTTEKKTTEAAAAAAVEKEEETTTYKNIQHDADVPIETRGSANEIV